MENGIRTCHFPTDKVSKIIGMNRRKGEYFDLLCKIGSESNLTTSYITGRKITLEYQCFDYSEIESRLSFR